MLVFFRLLGRVQVEVAEGVVNLDAAPIRGLLACLLLAEGRYVPASRLQRSLWDAPPKSAGNNLRLHIARLRGQLNAAEPDLGRRLSTLRSNIESSYGLCAELEEVDVRVFRYMFERGSTALRLGGHEQAELAFEEMIKLWRGQVGQDCSASDFLRSQFQALDALRISALERLAMARLGLGMAAELIPDIQSVLEVDPLREHSWINLIRACYLSGDIVGAFESWSRACTVLSSELGIDPSTELIELHRMMLHRNDDAIRSSVGAASG